MHARIVIRNAAIAVATATLACASQGVTHRAGAQEMDAVAEPGEWLFLFDGETLAGWRGYRRDDIRDGWAVVDNILTRVGSGGDIITEDQFADFELELEWNISPGGNSGIFFRATEETDRIYHSAPEMQVLDDAKHPDGVSLLTSAGADYGLHPVPEHLAKPPGEWNAVRIVADGSHIEYWLNGEKVVEYELGSPDWESRVANSKFVEWPLYGRATSGHIGLQDHGDWVAYRNIRIRELP
jgi:hypothetical protein